MKASRARSAAQLAPAISQTQLQAPQISALPNQLQAATARIQVAQPQLQAPLPQLPAAPTKPLLAAARLQVAQIQLQAATARLQASQTAKSAATNVNVPLPLQAAAAVSATQTSSTTVKPGTSWDLAKVMASHAASRPISGASAVPITNVATATSIPKKRDASGQVVKQKTLSVKSDNQSNVG